MRSRDQRVAGCVLRQQPGTPGWLRIEPDVLDGHERGLRARLLDHRGGKDVILPLYGARLRRVDGVMHIIGTELMPKSRKGRPWEYRQSWLCATDPADAREFLERVYVTSPTGFNAEDDDLSELPVPGG